MLGPTASLNPGIQSSAHSGQSSFGGSLGEGGRGERKKWAEQESLHGGSDVASLKDLGNLAKFLYL